MILSENIPARASTFLARCRRDVLHGRFAGNPDAYLEFLIQASQAADPRILEYLRVMDRATGEPRYYGEADHIVPRAVWVTLMPHDLLGPRAPDGYSAVLSNLFWRDPHFNATCDQPLIGHIREESRRVSRHTPQGRQWAEGWIQFFLDTKRDEGMLFAGIPVDPLTLDKRIFAAHVGTNWLVSETSG
jgi:hypothetical protein